jgi:hypothetical protein
MNSPETPPEVSAPKSADRRKLLRGGLAVAPVLMTIASRPVLGQVACTASAITSINLQSSINHNCTITSGLSPEKWKALADQWPSPYTGTTTAATGRTITYGGITHTYGGASTSATAYHCTTTGLGGHVFAGKSMVDVIDMMQSGGLNSLGRYIVAALLNARSGRTPMLSETNVRAMWNDLINRGYYEPTAGIRWGASEIVAYIKTTIA